MLDALAQPMLEALRGFPEQCREAVAIGRAFNPGAARPSAIVLTGLGGSAIGADLLRAYAAPTATVPIIVNRDYELPGFVDASTLVIAVSYSGNTEETLAAYRSAKARDAQVWTFTTGGTLAEQSRADGFPCCRIPGGMQPRAALGYGFFPLLLSLEQIGVLPSQAEAVESALQTVAQIAAACQVDGSRAHQLAQHLQRRIPVVYGSWNAVGVVACRWKGQVNENAKGMSFWNVFPELNHNETVGWSGIPELNRDLAVVLLRTPSDPPRIRRRIDLTRNQMAAQAPVAEAMGEGTTLLAQLFSLLVLGDWTSLYLAMARQQDPVEVRAIDAIKQALAAEEP